MNCRIWIATFALLGVSAAIHSQESSRARLNAESLLGLDEKALQIALPELTKLVRPIRGPGKTLGKWALRDAQFAIHKFDVRFFVNSAQVSRIEFVSTAPESQCRQMLPFEDALSELSRLYGQTRVNGKLEHGGRTTQSVAFNSATSNISLFMSVSPESCSTKIIYRTRKVKDASEL